MLKDLNLNKCCNLQNLANKNILKKNIKYSFCHNCNSVLIKSDNSQIHYTMKPRQKSKPTEFDPIELIKSMKTKTEHDYPFLNNEFNINNYEEYNLTNVYKSINIYLTKRKMIILTLQKMMKMFDFSDLIFYQTLFYIDTYLSHNITEEMSEKEILYYLVGYFLCSAKLKETDIYEPSFESLTSLKNKIYLTSDKIGLYEIICLQSIKYNIFSYSAYDWICELISIGFIFDSEINEENSIIFVKGHKHSIINLISKNALKNLLNLTVKNIFFKYSPMHIAFSLIQIAREKYLDENHINKKLFNYLINLFGVKFNDYKKCYNEIKIELEKKQEETNEKIKIEKKEVEIEYKNKEEPGDYTPKIIPVKMEKSIYVPDKTRRNSCLPNSISDMAKIKKLQEKNCVEDDRTIKNKEKNNSNENKDNKGNNIIIFDDSKEENNDQEIEFNFNYNIEIRDKQAVDKNQASAQGLNASKKKDNKHININCSNPNLHKSENKLPTFTAFFQNAMKKNQTKNEINEINNFSSKNETNKFLQTNQKKLNPVKNKKISNSSNKINNDNNNELKSDLNLNTVKQSLFHDNKKKITKDDPFKVYKKIRSSNYESKNTNFTNFIKENFNNNYKDKNHKDNYNEDNNAKKKCKSKGKSKNNLEGKETKVLISNRRNQSINFVQRKKKVKSTTLYAKNS